MGSIGRLVGWKVGGALAGAAGTLAMDLLWFGRSRRDGATSSFTDWETAAGLTRWEDAPAPGKVGRLVVETVTGQPLEPTHARTATNVMHWATGVGWAAAAGLVAGAAGARSPLLGPPFGLAVWSASYLTLVPLGFYEWPWTYDGETVWKDLSAHLVYGTTAGLVWWALRSAPRR
jgi:hypothetical protein